METEKSKFNVFAALIIILLITIIGSVIFLAVTINRTINSALSPIQNVNNALSTQVSTILNPTPTIIPDPITIIREVQSLARLETIQYTVEKIITAEISQGFFGPLFGDRLLFVAHGYVIAGVDLSKIAADDLWLDNGVLHVKLPDAEVFVATLNNEDSYIYDRNTGLFRQSDPNLETAARIAAEQEILNSAVEDGILVQAQQNAETYLERLFNALGYMQVIYE